MEPGKVATTTLWAALAFTWLTAAAPATKEPADAPRATSADRDRDGAAPPADADRRVVPA